MKEYNIIYVSEEEVDAVNAYEIINLNQLPAIDLIREPYFVRDHSKNGL